MTKLAVKFVLPAKAREHNWNGHKGEADEAL